MSRTAGISCFIPELSSRGSDRGIQGDKYIPG